MKKTVSVRPITLLVCFVCLVGLSVSATYLVGHAKYKKQSDKKDQEILTVQENNKSLENSLQRLKNEHGNLESQYKKLVSGLDAASQKSMQTASELDVALKDLETARADALKVRGELDAKLSEIEALNADRQALEQKHHDLKEILVPYLVLEPTWVNSGETTKAFDGNLIIVFSEASENDKCHKDSAAVSYLISGKDKKKLCLRTGKRESFEYQGKKYLLNLLESKESEGTHHYYFSIIKEM